jgi:molybdopterin-guanine dinucleotide biosynthesis protein A
LSRDAATRRSEGRLANVTGAVWVEEGFAQQAGARASELACFFEEVLVLDAPSQETGALGRLVAALEKATAERVLIVGSGASPPIALVLALTAWPESDVVAPSRGGRPDPLCAIYRRTPVLAAARTALAAGEASLEGLFRALAPGLIEGADLDALDPPPLR